MKSMEKLPSLLFIYSFLLRNSVTLANRTMSSHLTGIYSVVYITVPNLNLGKKLAHGLVETKLAACVNIIPQITSVYQWEGKIIEDNELLLMVKTRTSAVDNLTEYVKKHHSYAVPEIISLPIQNGNVKYLDWIGENVKEEEKDSK